MTDDDAKRLADGITRTAVARWGLFAIGTVADVKCFIEMSDADFVRHLVIGRPFTPRGLPDPEADAPHIVEPTP